MGALEFLRATWWPALVLAPLLGLVLVLRRRARDRRLAAHLGPRALQLMPLRTDRRRRARPWLFASALFLGLLAWLEPLLGEASGEMTWQGVDVVVALDVSRSMQATDLDPSRLVFAREALRDLASHAKGDRLGLVAFAGQARLIAPLTADRASWAQLVTTLEPALVPRGGTDLGAALELALETAQGRSGHHAAIVLLTDGEDFGKRGLRMARRCGARGVPVHCVGLGTRLGSKIPREDGAGFVRDRNGRDVVTALRPESLVALGEASGGSYVEAAGADLPLRTLYEDHILPRARAAATTRPATKKKTRYQWPLAAAALLWLVDLSLRDRRRR